MAEHLPLLVFPQKRVVASEPAGGFPGGNHQHPGKGRQVERLTPELEALRQSLDRYRASLTGALAGLEPELVLVLEIAGSLDLFQQAVEKAGLEWLGEIALDEVEPDDDFYEPNKEGEPTAKPLKGRLFLSMVNQAGLQELLSLWQQWVDGRPLPRGKGKWKDVFAQLRHIRRWGVEETLLETGMLDLWEDLLDPLDGEARVHFQIELFYRKSAERRARMEREVGLLINAVDGRLLGPFLDIPEIAFHAVKAELPARSIRALLDALERPEGDPGIQLFKFPGIMYFRPTGQSLALSAAEEGLPGEFVVGDAELPPVAALLDGAPLALHEALRGRLLLDDAFDMERHYQPGERKHGTSMASLILHGDLGGQQPEPLTRQLYCIPVMQPDPHHRNRAEHMPDEVFFEDRIHIAVKRMLEGVGDLAAQAPSVRVINISLGDPARPLIHMPSPWARLLDWLSWKYRVLFCVSAGNFLDEIDVGISHADFSQLQDDRKVSTTLQAVARSLSNRRLLSPAESINALTIGAVHVDEAGAYRAGNRIDLIPDSEAFSPAMRVGHGFRKSVKPEILMPGGRQLYDVPLMNGSTTYRPNVSISTPGQKVAWDSQQQGQMNREAHTSGTSNATALATRGAVQIYEMLDSLRARGDAIPDPLMSVLMKCLLVHGARQPEAFKDKLDAALRNPENSRKFKEVTSRYLGYGGPDIARVLACTEQRATVFGCDEIAEGEVHEYDFPLPPALSGTRLWRRLVVTLAWFTPINPGHRGLREAKLDVQPGGGAWSKSSLRVDRQDGDHNQVLRGTVQHEVLEGDSMIGAFLDGDVLRLRVQCKKDAIARLDERIPYGLAVTMEVREDIPIYAQIRDRIRPRVRAGRPR